MKNNTGKRLLIILPLVTVIFGTQANLARAAYEKCVGKSAYSVQINENDSASIYRDSKFRTTVPCERVTSESGGKDRPNAFHMTKRCKLPDAEDNKFTIQIGKYRGQTIAKLWKIKSVDSPRVPVSRYPILVDGYLYCSER